MVSTHPALDISKRRGLDTPRAPVLRALAVGFISHMGFVRLSRSSALQRAERVALVHVYVPACSCVQTADSPCMYICWSGVSVCLVHVCTEIGRQIGRGRQIDTYVD